MGEDVLLQEIYEVNRLIHCNDVWFDAESDEDLIESCIYQRESLRARYRYLLAAARKRGNLPLFLSYGIGGCRGIRRRL